MPYYKTELCNYYFQEKGKGKTLIFAHGLFVDHTIFSHQFEYLSSNYNCISIDMPAHGKSTFNKNGWTLDEIAEDFHRFIKTNKIETPILIGQSQGGMVFMRLAVKYPETIGGLVLIGTSPKAEYKDRLPFWNNVIGILNSDNKKEINDLLVQIQKNVVSPYFLQKFPAKALDELIIMQNHNAIGLKLATEAAVVNRTDFSNEIDKIQCKTLIVCGRDDHATPLSISEMMKMKIKYAQLKIIDKASHHIPIETPQILTTMLSGFMSTF